MAIRISQIAKDFDLKNAQVISIVEEALEIKKTASQSLNVAETDVLFDVLIQNLSTNDSDAYFSMEKPEMPVEEQSSPEIAEENLKLRKKSRGKACSKTEKAPAKETKTEKQPEKKVKETAKPEKSRLKRRLNLRNRLIPSSLKDLLRRQRKAGATEETKGRLLRSRNTSVKP